MILAPSHPRPEDSFAVTLRGVERHSRRHDPLAQAVDVLRRGGLVAYPTDTLYGLGADALNEAAVERVFEAKGRPEGMALPVVIGDIEQLAGVADPVPALAWRLAERFWPGALTLVVPRSPRIPALVGSRGWKVGVRLPDHPVPRELARRIGGPITGTSANRTGGPDPRAAADVRAQLGDRVDLVLEEGGSPPRGHASTVLDITGPVPRVLRLGAISASALEQVCRSPVVSGGDGVGP